METEIRLVLLVLGIIIILAIWWDGTRRQKTQKNYLVKKLKSADEIDTRWIAAETMADDREALLQEESLRDPILVSEEKSFEQEAYTHENFEEDAQSFIHEAEEPENSPKDFSEFNDDGLDTQEPSLESSETPLNTFESNDSMEELPFVLFSIVAKGNQQFGGFKLLQILLNHQFEFGDDRIFHYYDGDPQEQKKRFSLAAATETGEFDLSNMANFACKGLVLFFSTDQHQDPAGVFDEMVEVTERLAEALNGDLKIDHDREWTEENLADLYAYFRRA